MSQFNLTTQNGGEQAYGSHAQAVRPYVSAAPPQYAPSAPSVVSASGYASSHVPAPSPSPQYGGQQQDAVVAAQRAAEQVVKDMEMQKKVDASQRANEKLETERKLDELKRQNEILALKMETQRDQQANAMAQQSTMIAMAAAANKQTAAPPVITIQGPTINNTTSVQQQAGSSFHDVVIEPEPQHQEKVEQVPECTRAGCHVAMKPCRMNACCQSPGNCALCKKRLNKGKFWFHAHSCGKNGVICENCFALPGTLRVNAMPVNCMCTLCVLFLVLLIILVIVYLLLSASVEVEDADSYQ